MSPQPRIVITESFHRLELRPAGPVHAPRARARIRVPPRRSSRRHSGSPVAPERRSTWYVGTPYLARTDHRARPRQSERRCDRNKSPESAASAAGTTETGRNRQPRPASPGVVRASRSTRSTATAPASGTRVPIGRFRRRNYGRSRKNGPKPSTVPAYRENIEKRPVDARSPGGPIGNASGPRSLGMRRPGLRDRSRNRG